MKFSTYLTIFTDIRQYTVLPFCLVQKEEINRPEPGPSWKRAREDERGDFLKKLIEYFDTQNKVSSCRNAYCQNANHNAACDDYMMLNILHKMEQTARETQDNVK